MIQDFLYEEPGQVLHEAFTRHSHVWPFCFEAIDLAHLAFEHVQRMLANRVPGVADIRRIRNDISDNCWRYLKTIAQPLIEKKLIQDFERIEGGNVMVLPDGLTVRIKKANRALVTSNYPTKHIKQIASKSRQLCLFPDFTALDQHILDGAYIDIVFVPGTLASEFEYVGLKLSNLDDSPSIQIAEPEVDLLHKISPDGETHVKQFRDLLAG